MKAMTVIAALAATFLGGVVGCGANTGEKSLDDLKGDLEYCLELIAKRQLTDEEIDRAAREYYALFDNQCAARCIETTQANVDRVEPMKTRPGEPADLLARQYYSRVLYFSPTQAGSFIQQLTNEADPIRVADKKSSRIMTHGDILGVMNINRFIKQGSDPVSHTFSAREIDVEIVRYRRNFVDGVFKLPFRAGLAAELWAGLQQNWNRLDADQQQLVRLYFSDKEGTTSMSAATYQVLWDLSDAAALDWQRAFVREQQHARLEYISYIMMMGAAATISNNSEGYWRW